MLDRWSNFSFLPQGPKFSGSWNYPRLPHNLNESIREWIELLASMDSACTPTQVHSIPKAAFYPSLKFRSKEKPFFLLAAKKNRNWMYHKIRNSAGNSRPSHFKLSSHLIWTNSKPAQLCSCRIYEKIYSWLSTVQGSKILIYRSFSLSVYSGSNGLYQAQGPHASWLR